MKALIMMLKNTATETYHPILYFEKPFPDLESEGNRKLIRYKSKGHRTDGFKDRQDAVNSIETELTIEKINQAGYDTRTVEIEGDILWDGADMPIDVQIRNRN
jgi:hypothetical protein